MAKLPVTHQAACPLMPGHSIAGPFISSRLLQPCGCLVLPVTQPSGQVTYSLIPYRISMSQINSVSHDTGHLFYPFGALLSATSAYPGLELVVPQGSHQLLGLLLKDQPIELRLCFRASFIHGSFSRQREGSSLFLQVSLLALHSFIYEVAPAAPQPCLIRH